MIHAGAAGLLLACCLTLGLLGPIDAMPADPGIGAALAVWIASRRTNRAGLVGGMLAIPLVLAAGNESGRLALLLAVSLAIPSASRRADSAFIAALLGWRLLWRGVPWLAAFEVELSRLLSGAIGLATGQRLDFGPTAAGLDLFCVFVLKAMANRAASGVFSRRRLIVSGATIVVYIALLPSLASAHGVVPLDVTGLFNMANEHLAPRSGDLTRRMFGWLPVLFASLCVVWLAGATRRAAPRETSGVASRSLPPAGAVVLILSSLLVLLQWHASRPGGGRRAGEIVMLKAPTFDMSVPRDGEFGAARAGMFGMLPRYLALDGHRTRVHEGPVTSGLLARASLLIVILPPAPLPDPEVRAIDAFVERGGSLLLLGDHTDLLGTMTPVNRLLDRYGMALRFDSAYPAVREWRACLEGAGLTSRWFTGIGTGASIQTRGGVRPLVVGRYALSDAGDRKNSGRGAYLGDYSYQPGEQLSDLVLAARRSYGQGQVVAFGDTSSFQNLMLPRSYRFVARIVDDLTRPPSSGKELSAIAAGIAAGSLGVLALTGSLLSCGGLAAAGLAIDLALPWIGPGDSPLQKAPPDARVALIDSTHLNRFSREFWRDDSIGGLIVSLQREGFLPLLVDDRFADYPIRESDLPVLVAPRRPPHPDESARLEAHLVRGGDLLVAAGASERAGVEPLLSRFGVSIGETPLGPVPVRADLDPVDFELARGEPQFREAHPVILDGSRPSTVFYRAFQRDIVVAVEVGDARERPGRLLVIGDPAFLTDRVLENETTAWPGNVRLLGRLLKGESEQ